MLRYVYVTQGWERRGSCLEKHLCDQLSIFSIRNILRFQESYNLSELIRILFQNQTDSQKLHNCNTMKTRFKWNFGFLLNVHDAKTNNKLHEVMKWMHLWILTDAIVNCHHLPISTSKCTRQNVCDIDNPHGPSPRNPRTHIHQPYRRRSGS